MSASIDQVTHEAMSLPIAEQARLARTLLDSLATAAAGQTRNDGTAGSRRDLMQRFVSGEWGVDLSGYESARSADRAAATEQWEAKSV